MLNGGKKKSLLLSSCNNFRKVELLSSSAYTKSIVKRIEEEHTVRHKRNSDEIGKDQRKKKRITKKKLFPYEIFHEKTILQN